eukprot:tig00001094_g6994.t1
MDIEQTFGRRRASPEPFDRPTSRDVLSSRVRSRSASYPDETKSRTPSPTFTTFGPGVDEDEGIPSKARRTAQTPSPLSFASNFGHRTDEADSDADNHDSERSCDHCGSKHTSQWRKGPNGANTLCNACGLHWSRSQKRGGRSQTRNVTPPAKPAAVRPAALTPAATEVSASPIAFPATAARPASPLPAGFSILLAAAARVDGGFDSASFIRTQRSILA